MNSNDCCYYYLFKTRLHKTDEISDPILVDFCIHFDRRIGDREHKKLSKYKPPIDIWPNVATNFILKITLNLRQSSSLLSLLYGHKGEALYRTIPFCI